MRTDATASGLDPAIAARLKRNEDGLVAAIAQQHDTGEVLMVAWMSRESVRVSLAEGIACYWSRSRQALWRKGETSGHTQHVDGIYADCDRDTLLVQVHQDGVACHTGRRNCFFRAWRDGAWTEIAAPLIAPEQLYKEPKG